jgi:hypothetical protein
MLKIYTKAAIPLIFFTGLSLVLTSCDKPNSESLKSSTSSKMTLNEARSKESYARDWAKKRIETSTHSKVVEINGFGWDQENNCHVFGGMIDSDRSDNYKTFDIRVGINRAGEWTVQHINIK